MARIDKTDSAIGVVRAVLKADIPEALWDEVSAVGLDASGLAVVGAGAAGSQTGTIGIVIGNKYLAKAGMQIDIFKLGDVVDLEGLVAGSQTWLAADGTLTQASAAGLVYAGYTVEADRLVLSGFAGVVAAA
jgi:hypothetical protein